MTPDEQTQMLALAPTLKEMVQRHNLYYHVKERNYDRLDHVVVGLHIEDTVWGEMYFDHGAPGTVGDRLSPGARGHSDGNSSLIARANSGPLPDSSCLK